MSGNKLNIILLLLLIGSLQACSLFEQISRTPAPRKPVLVKNDSSGHAVAANTGNAGDTLLPEKEKSKYLKEEYHLAVLLPFYLDNSYLTALDPEEKKYSYRPMVATEYLQGLLIAIEDLKNSGINLKVSIFDTRNDSATVRDILRQEALKDADLIIGPLFPRNLALVAPFAAKHHILLISPLSSKVPLREATPEFIKARPGDDAHVERLARYAAMHFRQYPTYIFHTADPDEKALANYMARIYRESLPYGNEEKELHLVELEEDGSFEKDLLSAHDTNIVLVPSNNEIFVTNILRGLNNVTEGEAFNLGSNSKKEDIKYLVSPEDIFLFGMPSWIEKFASSRFDYLNTLNFYTTREFFYDTASAAYRHFRGAFIDTFHYAPSLISMKAYDICFYMGHLLSRYGSRSMDYFDFYHHAPINGQIEIRPVYRIDPKHGKEILHHHENRYVHILRFDAYKLELAPGFLSK